MISRHGHPCDFSPAWTNSRRASHTPGGELLMNWRGMERIQVEAGLVSADPIRGLGFLSLHAWRPGTRQLQELMVSLQAVAACRHPRAPAFPPAHRGLSHPCPLCAPWSATHLLSETRLQFSLFVAVPMIILFTKRQLPEDEAQLPAGAST